MPEATIEYAETRFAVLMTEGIRGGSGKAVGGGIGIYLWTFADAVASIDGRSDATRRAGTG